MNLQEISKKLDINLETLERLNSKKVFDFETLSEFSDEKMERLSLVLSLEKIGLTSQDIHEYVSGVENRSSGNTSQNLIEMLREYRGKVLHSLHYEQEKLSSIDFMIYELKQSDKFS